MINIREFLRRLMKYIIMVVIVWYACYTIPTCRHSTKEMLWIAVIAGLTFTVLDLITPSIDLKVQKN